MKTIPVFYKLDDNWFTWMSELPPLPDVTIYNFCPTCHKPTEPTLHPCTAHICASYCPHCKKAWTVEELTTTALTRWNRNAQRRKSR